MAKKDTPPVRRITLQRPAGEGMTADYILEVYEDGRLIRRWGGTRDAVATLSSKKIVTYPTQVAANHAAETARDEKLAENKGYAVVSDRSFPDAPAAKEDRYSLFGKVQVQPGALRRRWESLLSLLKVPLDDMHAVTETLQLSPGVRIDLNRSRAEQWTAQVAADIDRRDAVALVHLTALAFVTEIDPTDGTGKALVRSSLVDELRRQSVIPSRDLLEAVDAIPRAIDLMALRQAANQRLGAFAL